MALSVSIVSYEKSTPVIQGVESLLATVKQLSGVIIVDNSETDDCFQSLSSHFASSPKVRCIRNSQNTGYGSGNNLAVIESRETYHLIMNPDVRVSEGSVDLLIRFMDENPDVAVVTPSIFGDDGVRQNLCKRYPTVFDLFLRRMPGFIKQFFHQKMKAYEYDGMYQSEPFDVDWSTGSFLLFRKSVLDQLNGFDDRFFMYFEDVDLCRRAHDYGRVVCYPSVQVTHSWARDSAHNHKLFYIHIQSMFRYFQKWGWVWF